MTTRQFIPSKPTAATLPSFTPVRSGLLQRKCACGGTPGQSGECEECRKKRETGMLQRFGAPPSTLNSQRCEAPPIVHEVLRSPGEPLDATTRAFMEPRFGHDFGGVRTSASRISQSDFTVAPANDPLEREADQTAENALRTQFSSPSARSTQWPRADFSRVRIHTDARAADSTSAVNAKAYTVGQDIVFGSGRYTPDTDVGRKLLAHELAHVMQQRGMGEGARLQRQAPATPPGPKSPQQMMDDSINQAAVLTMDAQERIIRLRTLSSEGKLDKATKQDANTLRAVQKWLRLDFNRRQEFSEKLDKAVGLMRRFLTVVPIVPAKITGTDPKANCKPGNLATAYVGDPNGVVHFCDDFFPKGPQCQRNIVIHERFHLAGIHHGEAKDGKSTEASKRSPDEALNSADDMMDLVKDVMGQPIVACSTGL
jgi:hypothetical protein